MKPVRPLFAMVLLAPLALAGITGCKAKASAKVRAGDDGLDASGSYGDERKDGDGSWEGSSPPKEEAGRSVQPHPVHAGERFVTLPGFRMNRDGTSRVFVEIGGDVAVDEARSPGQLVYTLRQVKVPDKVNLFDLPTTYFRTPVSRVRLVQLDNDAQLIIELRQPAHSEMHVRKSPGGTVLSVDFPTVAESNEVDEAAPQATSRAPEP